jgi:hypothetical protein
MKRLARRVSLAAIAVLLGSLSAQSQTSRTQPLDEGEFHFVRLAYQGGYGRSRYTTDFPEAETHLRQGLDRLTRVETGTSVIVAPSSDDIMNYPWLYAVEVGSWYLDDLEAAKLREYLLRGGFLMVDDFHGTRQWADFEVSMQRVFPDRPIVEIPESDALMHLLYDLNKDIQIPGIQYVSSRRTYEQDGYMPHWRGIYDDDERLMVAINFNMDLGDAWEHADDPRYPEPMTGLAIRFAVNYVIYSMTH